MADMPDTTPEHATTPGPGLLVTKLRLPRPPADFVARRRLLERLDDGLARELTLVSAPAGFGKTSLLADWSQRSERLVAWLSLDAGDNDPVRFWRHTVAALDGVRPGVAERLAPLLGPPAPASFEGLATAVVNELAAEDGDALLVLDDYHLIEAQPVHTSLQFLLEHQPPALHVVLATRADPQLPLARLRARGQLTELRAADLMFTVDEAADLLLEAAGVELREDAVAALVARTEGWAAGLQLAALSLQHQPDVAGFVASFSGSHRHVLDYLTEEVLERQPEAVRGFLLETSVLDRLSGPLCDAVTGRADGQQMLESIERANLFLAPLDEVRGWWRYHHLFADLLRARLQQRWPERVAQLHRNAGSWHEEHGPVDDAVNHALAAGDAVWAARMIERHADELLLRSEGATLQRWLAALPPGTIDSRPRLLITQTRFAGLEKLDGLLDAAERAHAQTADEPYEPSVGLGVSRLANVPAMIAVGRAFVSFSRGDGEATMAGASRALAEIGPGEWWLDSLAQALVGAAAWLGGQLGQAERAMASSMARWQAADVHDQVELWSQYLGKIQCARGRLDLAAATYQQVLEVGAAPDRPARPAASTAHVGLAFVAFHRNDFDTALEHLDEGLRLCRQFGNPDSLANGLAILAWIRRIRGDMSPALQAMEEAARVSDPTVVDLLNSVPAHRARLLLSLGDVAAAARWTEQRGLAADDEPSYPREVAHLLLARVLLAQGRSDQALRLLDRLHAAAVAQDRTGSVIEIQTLRALGLAALGDDDGAVATLAEALTLAHPQGYVRVFVDEGAPMGSLLGQLIRTHEVSVPGDYVGRLVRALENDLEIDRAGPASDERPTAAAVPGLVTALSNRELEVLHLLAAGKQNQDIADELHMALNTVKKHATHIFEKLGATNRTEATVRAREYGLLT
jgi:LuxR family transcriptional regulator, maltose regulon positive regulatory protein